MPDIFDQLASGSPQNGQNSAPPPTAPPQGDIFDQLASNSTQLKPTQFAEPTPSHPFLDKVLTGVGNFAHQQLQENEDLGSGIGQGLVDTIKGGMHIANKVNSVLPDALSGILPDSVNRAVQSNEQHGQQAEQFLQNRNQQLHQNVQNHGIESLGKGVESLAEFLIPGEGEVGAAGKAMSYADRLAEGAKAAKLIENSPKLQKLVHAGVKALASGGEQAAIQGGQTLVKTGGDVGEAAKTAAVAGGVGGVLGGAGSVISDALKGGGEASNSVQKLGDMARGADSKVGVAQDLADTVDSNYGHLTSNYGDTLRGFQDETKGVTVPYQDSPLHKTVQELLNKGKTETTPFDAALDKSRPGSDRVNQTLQELNDLAKPPEAPAPEKWTDANGVDHVEQATAPDAKPIDMDMKTLLDQRKLIGERLRGIKGFDSDDLADKRVYGKLLEGIDDTMDGLVQKADKPEISEDYQHLRQNYKEHIGAFDDAAIKKITNPKGVSADVASDFLSSKNWPRNQNQLQKVLDPMGTQGDAPLQQFGHRVFETLVKDATPEDGAFNASKFLDKWGKISPDAKARLFGTGKITQGIQGPQTLLDSLTADAKGVRNVQRLTRVGLIAGAGPLAIAHPAVAGVLGTAALITETSGTHAARNFIDFVANNPNTWKAFKFGGKMAEHPMFEKGMEDTTRVLSHEAGQAFTDK